MNRKFVFSILFFCLLSFSYLFALEDVDSLLADIYIKYAYEQFESGSYRDAFELSEVSLSFSGSSSDGLFIHGVSGREIGEGIDSLKELSLSIVKDSWKYYNELTARVYLSQYHYMAGDIESAYINLEPFKSDLSSSSLFTEIFIKIAVSLQEIDEAVKTAEMRLSVDPYDNYAQLTMSMYNSKWLINATQNILSGDPAGFYARNIVQSIIRRSTGAESILSFYKNRWGRDWFYSISDLASADGNIIDYISKIFPDNSSVTFKDLLWGYSFLNTEEEKTSVLNYLMSINMEILYDLNSDSIEETRVFYSGGVLTEFLYDVNQDGDYDFLIYFNEGIPVKLIINGESGDITFYYKDYPNLIRVVDSGIDLEKEYLLIPYSLTLDILELPENLLTGIPFVDQDITIPDDSVLTENSTRKSTADTETKRISNYIRLDSEKSVEKIFEADGAKIIERHYRNSILITLYRDFNSDGIFDTVYNYKDAVLTSVTFDENNNGVVDYMESYGDEFIKSWDFNEDGLIDSRDRYLNGVLIREISTKMNGVFDTSFELTEGTVK